MDDEQILELYFRRDEGAISATADKYEAYCTAIAKNILVSTQDAEECVNDTYWNTWNSIPPHRPKVFCGYLGKITRNLAFNRYKYKTADKRGEGQLPLVLDELGDCVSGKDSVEEAFDAKALAEDINGFLSTLSPEKRRIFLCRYFYTDSIDTIAQRHGMSYGGVAMVLSRLRSKLHNYLTKRGHNL
jgi:RNA polymerase sigma-70 factor (ECF subfamily)